MVRGNSYCAPGVICFSPSMIVFLIMFIIVGFGLFTYLKMNSHIFMGVPSQQPIINVLPSSGGGGDDRYTQAPLPLKQDPYMPNFGISTRGLFGSSALLQAGGGGPPSLNIPTRGMAPDYKPMGTLKKADGSYLPLYGRPTTRSDRFNYYTRTDTYNPVPLPLEYKKRDCMDDVGCNELMSGDEIRVRGDKQSLHVSLYNTEIPIVL
jgi:hypothetical protein